MTRYKLPPIGCRTTETSSLSPFIDVLLSYSKHKKEENDSQIFFFGPKIGLVLFFAHNLLYQLINMAIKITFSRQLLKAFLIFLEAIKSKIKAWRDLMFGVVLHAGSKTTVIWIHKW